MSMNTEIVEVEIVSSEVEMKLVKYASESGLEKPVTESLVHAFAAVFSKARGVLSEAVGVAASVKDATCVTEIKRARACRLAIRAVRLEGEGVHKKEKEAALRFGRAVDGFRNILLADLAPVEQALQDAEDTAERAEAARKAALKGAREAELVPLLDEPLLGNLADLSEVDYQKKLSSAKLLRRLRLDASVKAETERLAAVEVARVERVRMAADNARLQAEVIVREAAAKLERKAAEKKLAEERAEAVRAADAARKERTAAILAANEVARKARVEVDRLKSELVERRKREDDIARKAQVEGEARAKAERAAAAAPDIAKLLAYAAALRALSCPCLGDKARVGVLRDRRDGFIRFVENMAEDVERTDY